MTTKMTKWVVGMAVVGAVSASAGPTRLIAQAPQEATAKPPAPAPQLVKVSIVVAHYQGEKRTVNLPYVFYAAVGERTLVRTGSQIPIPQTTIKAGEAPVSSFMYQNVGVNIDCAVDVRGSGIYRVLLNIQDSWVSDAANNRPPATGQLAAPVIQSWSFNNIVLLRDGQTLQYATATDKVSGEVVKIDVSLDVIK